MSLIDKINDDLKEAMKNKEKEKLSVIRMLKSAVHLSKIELKHDLTDDDVIGVVSKQIKMCKDSINEFSKAGREDLVDQYQKEVDILNSYMPEQISLEDATKVIEEAFEKIKPTSQKQIGLIMKEVSPKLKGVFDMGEASKIIKDKLNNL